MVLYKVGLHSGAAAVTSKVDNVRSFLHCEPAGRYEIEALTRRSLWMSIARRSNGVSRSSTTTAESSWNSPMVLRSRIVRVPPVLGLAFRLNSKSRSSPHRGGAEPPRAPQLTSLVGWVLAIDLLRD